MKNKLLLTISILTLVFCFSFLEEASVQETTTDQYFRVESEVGRQSVWNNSIPINVYITPHSDFDKVEVTFNHGSMTEVKYNGPQFFPVSAGETYRVQARMHPKEQGTHHITINSIAWEYNTNYTSSASTNIQIDENLQIVPQTSMYKVLNVLKIIFIILLVATTIAGIGFLIFKNLEKIKKWLEPEF
jgi:hypothetical protein